MRFLVALLLIGSAHPSESGMAAPVTLADSISVDRFLRLQDKLDTTEKKLIEVRDELIEALTEVKQLRAENKTLRDGQSDSESDVAKLKEQISDLEKKVTDLEKELDKVKKENEKLKEDSSTKNQQLMKEAYEKVSLELKEAKEKLASKSEELLAVQSELDQMSAVKEQWFKQLVNDARNDWLNRSLKDIEPSALEKTLVVYQQYASEDQSLKEVSNELKGLLENSLLYRDALGALHVEYDPAQVNRMASLAKASMDSEANPLRKKEWADVYDKLDNYWARVSICQDLVQSVDNSIKGRSKTLWESFINAVIDKEEKNFATMTAINSIPWLKDQFAKYKEAVLQSGLDKNEFRDTILNLKAE